MIEFTIDATDLEAVKTALLHSDVERCAVLFASQVTRPDGLTRLLVRDYELAAADDYATQGTQNAELRPALVARVTKRARREKLSLVFVHSHPGFEAPHFSLIDDMGESRLAGFLGHRHPDNIHAALVMSAGGVRARQLGTINEIRVMSLGERRVIHFDPERATEFRNELFDRQVRAFGASGQHALERLRVAIVGLGGTGSMAAQQLVHLGIRKFILVDPDVIEATNLNRVVGAMPPDLGNSKVEVAARYIRSFAPDVEVTNVVGDIIKARIAQVLFDADVIFGCTDSHGSRAVLQQVSYQYLIPYIDIGTTITTNNGRVTGIFGRVQLLAPGNACLSCSDVLSPEEVRRDMMSAFERKSDPYIQGAREPAPAVVSLNGTVVSLAVTMLLGFVTEIPTRARYVIYNAMTSTLRSVRSGAKANCYICSRKGTFARGNGQRLFARQD
jgi:molybdopterin/thiamine biosynthesis adenylyltransferase